jgi:hypothetical protein
MVNDEYIMPINAKTTMNGLKNSVADGNKNRENLRKP